MAGLWLMTANRAGFIEAPALGASMGAARGAILQLSRFRAINFVFGHLRPGERNVLDDLSPIL